MNKSLRYISVSHKTASTIQREKYHLSDTEKELLTHLIRSTFSDISGLFILATCNRTEIYFEAIHTTKNDLTALLIDFKSIQNKTSEQMVFISSNQTETSIQHLLEVSSGLESLVFGDAEIISQIKKAHQFSMHYKMQGSLLERALQAVFKTHKRISNETNFRDGTTSVAYKSLKVIRQTYDSETVKSKKILFVGAGDIVKQLFKYNSKFNFNNIYISNRSLEKAIILAQANQCHTYPWEHVLSNNFDDFDVIISAASNCPNLINNISASKKPLLIDLAVPCNIDKRLKEIEHVIFHDLDSISVELEETKEHRLAATDEVNGIINEEIESYKEWLEGGLLRALLAEFKIKVHTKVKTQLNTIESSKITLVTNQVMKKIMVQNELTINVDDIDSLICEEISSLHI
ncbi:MAG: glutamyl-tRNA reductase [Flavobacteriaceae bacterium CG_4_10_14_3_um_filter_33_47]|nr:glutamyl-tRNA reductase [Flavobacteriia bacterium]PIV93226.1 MAG: glutamyl-tRNA reductase [Flavobacteriaceae bacterium CG17_big_fil_post_rev_8_21_14_2_50_33_15]PIY12833.1 MAG: glutamyl-tRNA reductase [Flavobacteriaceae bacterium CG_4_10_14_3_um_filter_33_47]PJB20007.1 MAG: glutamyl-tRNA reductase [Flavobacteriaceae bacterium CG_4_9_14_3_um_filter_33_16]